MVSFGWADIGHMVQVEEDIIGAGLSDVEALGEGEEVHQVAGGGQHDIATEAFGDIDDEGSGARGAAVMGEHSGGASFEVDLPGGLLAEEAGMGEVGGIHARMGRDRLKFYVVAALRKQKIC